MTPLWLSLILKENALLIFGGRYPMKRLVFALLCCYMSAAQAEIYKYIDAQGHVTYTNIPTKGAQRVQLTPLSSYHATEPHGKKASSASSSEPGVKVDSGIQKQRDSGRRKILEDELSNEQKALASAEKALADGKATRNGDERNYQKYLDRIKGLQDTVTAHQKNAAAIRQELGQVPKGAP